MSRISRLHRIEGCSSMVSMRTAEAPSSGKFIDAESLSDEPALSICGRPELRSPAEPDRVYAGPSPDQ